MYSGRYDHPGLGRGSPCPKPSSHPSPVRPGHRGDVASGLAALWLGYPPSLMGESSPGGGDADQGCLPCLYRLSDSVGRRNIRRDHFFDKAPPAPGPMGSDGARRFRHTALGCGYSFNRIQTRAEAGQGVNSSSLNCPSGGRLP